MAVLCLTVSLYHSTYMHSVLSTMLGLCCTACHAACAGSCTDDTASTCDACSDGWQPDGFSLLRQTCKGIDSLCIVCHSSGSLSVFLMRIWSHHWVAAYYWWTLSTVQALLVSVICNITSWSRWIKSFLHRRLILLAFWKMWLIKLVNVLGIIKKSTKQQGWSWETRNK